MCCPAQHALRPLTHQPGSCSHRHGTHNLSSRSPSWSRPWHWSPAALSGDVWGTVARAGGILLGSAAEAPSSNPTWPQTPPPTRSPPPMPHRALYCRTAVLTQNGVSWPSTPCPAWKTADVSVSATAGRGWQSHAAQLGLDRPAVTSGHRAPLRSSGAASGKWELGGFRETDPEEDACPLTTAWCLEEALYLAGWHRLLGAGPRLRGWAACLVLCVSPSVPAGFTHFS